MKNGFCIVLKKETKESIIRGLNDLWSELVEKMLQKGYWLKKTIFSKADG